MSTALSPQRAVERAIAFSGRSREAARALLLVGGQDTRLLRAALERCPSLQYVLVVEPDPLVARELQPLARDPSFDLALDVVGPEALGADCNFLSVYLTLCRTLSRRGCGPSELLLVRDEALERLPQGAAVATAADNLVHGGSRDILQLLSRKPSLARLRSSLADFHFERTELATALQLYWGLPPTAQHPGALQNTFECLVALGCPSLARRWLEQTELSGAQLAAWTGQVDAALPPEIERRAARFEKNLAWIEPRFGELARALRRTPAPADVHALQLPDVPWLLEPAEAQPAGADGRRARRHPYPLLVRVHAEGLEPLNLPSRVDVLDEALTTSTSTRGQDHAGIGGWVRHSALAFNLLRVPSYVAHYGWRRLTFLLEQDLGALRALFEQLDWTEVLSAETARPLVGPGASEALVRAFEENMNLPAPSITVGLPEAFPQGLARRQVAVAAGARERRDALARRYEGFAPRLLDVLRERSRPLSIAIVTSIYTTVLRHVGEDLAAGFRALGHRACVLREQRPGEVLHALSVADSLLEHSPDFAILLDHVRPEQPDLLPAGMPVLSWILDELPRLKDPALIEKLGPLDLAFGFSPTVQRLLQSLGYPWVGHLPFAVNPERYQPEPPCEDATGIAYPTHVTAPPDRAGINALLRARFSCLPRIPLEMGKILPLLDGCLAELGATPDEQQKRGLLHHALMVARQQDRVQVAEQLAAAGLPLDLYGHGWELHPTLCRHARGAVQPGPDLRALYRAHRAVLHINLGCNMHPRVLETLCSGGLVVARADPPAAPETRDASWQLGDALPLFDGPQSMIALLQRALSDSAFRTDTIRRGQALVLADHTFECRARSMLGALQSVLETHPPSPRRGERPGPPRAGAAARL